jgi:hypothetical protein
MSSPLAKVCTADRPLFDPEGDRLQIELFRP